MARGGRRVPHRSPPGAPAGSPPQPLWPGGSTRFGGRFTPKGGPPAVYLASDPNVALQEVNAVLMPPGAPPVAIPSKPQVLVQVDVVLTGVLDLTDAAVQSALGTSVQELTGDWRFTMLHGAPVPTHELALACHASGRIAALRTYSAKCVGLGFNLVVFADRVRAPHRLSVRDPSGRLAQVLP